MRNRTNSRRTPYEYICKVWTSEPDRFIVNPIHQMPGLNKYGLVLKPGSFGLGTRLSRKAIKFAFADDRIPFVTFLLPTSRKNSGWLTRLEATFVEQMDYDGPTFLTYRLDTG